jgi:hypothetical protein
VIIYQKHVNECEKILFYLYRKKIHFPFFSVKLRESDTTPELAEPYFYYGQALLYLGLNEQQVFGSDIVKG